MPKPNIPQGDLGDVLEFVDLFPFFGIRRENEKMGTDLFYYTGFPIKLSGIYGVAS